MTFDIRYIERGMILNIFYWYSGTPTVVWYINAIQSFKEVHMKIFSVNTGILSKCKLFKFLWKYSWNMLSELWLNHLPFIHECNLISLKNQCSRKYDQWIKVHYYYNRHIIAKTLFFEPDISLTCVSQVTNFV